MVALQEGKTPLHIAACLNRVPAAKALIQAARKFKTSLDIHGSVRGCVSSRFPVAPWRLTHSRVPRTTVAVPAQVTGTPLHYAARCDSSDVLKLLIENGADAYARTADVRGAQPRCPSRAKQPV